MIKFIDQYIDFELVQTYYKGMKLKTVFKKRGDNMPLALASLGEVRTIVGFTGKDEIKKHLNNLGFIKGENVQILGENQSGMIVLVKDVRVAVNRALMTKIIVEQEEVA